jgi:hypothetical protein
MKVQEVILRAVAKKTTWWQAAEIMGISDRSMRRLRERYEQYGFDGLLDRRRCRPSEKRVALSVGGAGAGLYRDRYFEGKVRHVHEKLVNEHGIGLSYTWVKAALLQGAGRWRADASTGSIASGERAGPAGHAVTHPDSDAARQTSRLPWNSPANLRHLQPHYLLFPVHT